ncbi:monooxygenase-like protein [Xylariaceae sp. FL0255]|nr:monooxygenase-like protein [Xylariaceae sp. FL0255]
MAMDDITEVVIIGAGPAGLTIALSLAKFKVKSTILERELEITEDPRGVYLAHDAVRIIWNLGLGDEMDKIGHETRFVNFHKTTILNPPFFKMDTSAYGFAHALPNGIFQIQPLLELALQKKVQSSPYCDLRRGCTVTGRDQVDDGVIITYTNPDGQKQSIRGSWLVGADGKRGVVRKHFLEPSADIRQVESNYKYDGTWVAANLKITLPTSETHPHLPFWNMGLTPEDVYALFWPIGWHFASPPGKPLAAGRFGPHEARLWRHEFAQNNWDDSMNAEALLWEHLIPMITRKSDEKGKAFPDGEVTYPRDCIEIMRCRSFHFTHKVVNKWYDDRTILIGNAAHVFPPFGGQGIASGFRDAHQLAWRLDLLQRLPRITPEARDGILQAWSRERTASIEDAAAFTKLNGQLCNEGDSWALFLLRTIVWVMKQIPFIREPPDPSAITEARGFRSVPEGFFSSRFNGGGRIPQVWVSSSRHYKPVLSDSILGPNNSAFTLLVLAGENSEKEYTETKAALETMNFPAVVLGPASIRMICSTPQTAQPGTDGQEIEIYFPTPLEKLSSVFPPIRPLYAPANLFSRFTRHTKFVIIRPDLFAFGLMDNFDELIVCLSELKDRLGC